MKRLQIPKNLCTQNFTNTKKFYVHEIAVVDLYKIYFLKNAKKRPNNRNLNRDWITTTCMRTSEAVIRRCSAKKVFLKISQNSLKKTFARTFLIKLQASGLQLLRVRISGSHFAKCEDILSFCEALPHRNNKNAKLSLSFLAPKFVS